ncbi:MAG: hypothetical protein FWF12_06315 [Betaproteobacteria bacterium]|nr:hypothetical protein [Betaproteobacteria bacterium]
MDEDGFRETASRILWRMFLSAVLLCLVFMALRFGVIEKDLLPRGCGPGGSGSGLSCGLAWLLTQSFHAQRLGIIALMFGVLGFLGGIRLCSWAGWLAGLAGLILYSPDYATVGALLGLFSLLRAYAPVPTAHENGQG